MSGPKSFKQLLKNWQPHQPKPLVYNPIPNSHIDPQTLAEIRAKQAIQKQQMVAFTNKLRCPLCDSQLDGSVTYEYAALYCRTNPSEYKARYEYGHSDPITEVTTVNFCLFAYELNSIYSKAMQHYNNEVYKIDTSNYLDERRQQANKEKLYGFSGIKLKISKEMLNEKYWEQKLKLYITFS